MGKDRLHIIYGNCSTLHALSSFTERQNEKKCKKTLRRWVMSKYLEVGKVYKAQITETYFKHKDSGKIVEYFEHEAEAGHIISSTDGDESALHFLIGRLSDESNELTLDEIENILK